MAGVSAVSVMSANRDVRCTMYDVFFGGVERLGWGEKMLETGTGDRVE